MTARAQGQGYSGKSHVEVAADVGGAILLLLQDPLLTDLRSDVTPDEISSQLALLQGRAFTLRLRTYQDQAICEKNIFVLSLRSILSLFYCH
jgi:hypothetical protein